MRDIADDWSPDRSLDVGNSENDDPSLLLLFQHLKSKSMQTAKGTSEIPGKLEFDFVLHNARVFFRMGKLFLFAVLITPDRCHFQAVIRLPWICYARGPSNDHSSRPQS